MSTNNDNDPATKASLEELVRQGIISEPTTAALKDVARQSAVRLATRPMVVDVVVKVVASHRTPTQLHAERVFEGEAVAAVGEAVSKLKCVGFVSAELLGFEHSKWVYELGMTFTDGLPRPGRLVVYDDGSWSFRTPTGEYTDAPGESGRDLKSMAQFILQIKGVTA